MKLELSGYEGVLAEVRVFVLNAGVTGTLALGALIIIAILAIQSPKLLGVYLSHRLQKQAHLKNWQVQQQKIAREIARREEKAKVRRGAQR